MDTDIDTDDIPIAQSIFLTGNAVADDVIDGSTDSGRERWNYRAPMHRWHCSITYITGDSPSAANVLLGYLVDFRSCDAWFHMWTYHLIRLCDNTSGLPQLLNLLF